MLHISVEYKIIPAWHRDIQPAGGQFQPGQGPGQVRPADVLPEGLADPGDLPGPAHLLLKVALSTRTNI